MSLTLALGIIQNPKHTLSTMVQILLTVTNISLERSFKLLNLAPKNRIQAHGNKDKLSIIIQNPNPNKYKLWMMVKTLTPNKYKLQNNDSKH